MKFDLFSELLQTVADFDDGITVSHLVSIPAGGYLNQIADDTTISRCLKKLQAERESLRSKE